MSGACLGGGSDAVHAELRGEFVPELHAVVHICVHHSRGAPVALPCSAPAPRDYRAAARTQFSAVLSSQEHA